MDRSHLQGLNLKHNKMKNYQIKSYHEVFVDDYNEGEGEFVNSYVLSDYVHADTPKEAVNKYLQDNLGYNLDFNNCEVNPEDRRWVQTCCLVDSENQQPSNNMLSKWKQGKVELYSNHIELLIYEVKEITFEL